MTVVAWGLLTAGLFHDLVTGPWQSEDAGYSPFILLLAIFMGGAIAQRHWQEFRTKPANSGLIFLILALLLFLAGRGLGNVFMAWCGVMLTACSALALHYGWAILGRFGLPILALGFAAPLPGSVITALTFPL
ncbi:MAG: exosortase, partial [Pseudomonadota bacterium]